MQETKPGDFTRNLCCEKIEMRPAGSISLCMIHHFSTVPSLRTPSAACVSPRANTDCGKKSGTEALTPVDRSVKSRRCVSSSHLLGRNSQVRMSDSPSVQRRTIMSNRWLESCDLRVSSAEAEYLRRQPQGGTLRFRLTLMDKDLLGGEQAICSLEAAVTSESLSTKESSVLWHRLFAQVQTANKKQDCRPFPRVQTVNHALGIKSVAMCTLPTPYFKKTHSSFTLSGNSGSSDVVRLATCVLSVLIPQRCTALWSRWIVACRYNFVKISALAGSRHLRPRRA